MAMKLTLGLIVVAICLILAFGRGANGTLPMSPSQKLRDLEHRVLAIEHQLEQMQYNFDRATLERAHD